MIKKKLLKNSVAVTLAASMVLGSSSTALALQDGQGDDYTQETIQNGGGVGGTVYDKEKYNYDQVDVSDVEIPDNPEETTQTDYPDVFPKELLTAETAQKTDEEIYEIIDAILPVMTFEEKVNMLSMNTDPEGRSGVGYMTGVPRLGIPESRMHDGPAGISTSGDSYVETTNMPIQLLASATWSEDLIYQYGEALGKEHVSTGSGWQLGVQYDLARTPFWARAKDTFGEDYYLTSRLSVAETKGVQENGGIAMAKHIGAYSTDGDTKLFVEVDDQTLHTAYLYPFETAVKEAQLASIMGTYNRLNGYYTSSNYQLQVNILRNMWGWTGAMVPDWGANQEFSLMLGTDISQESASTIRQRILAAIKLGNLTWNRVDRAVRNALYAYGVSGYLNLVEIDEDTGLAKEDPDQTRIQFERTYEEDREAGLYEENNEIALEIAEKGIILLKNDEDESGEAALPLDVSDYTGDKSVALIGPGAEQLMGGTGGERSFGVLEYMTTPSESVQEIAQELAGDKDINIRSEIMENIHGETIPAEYFFLDAEGTENGLTFTGTDADGNDMGTEVISQIEFLTGERSFFNNAEKGGTAFEDEGEKHTISGYLQVPEGLTSLVIQTNGGSANVTLETANGTKSGRASDGVSWDDYTTEGLNYSTINMSGVEPGLYKLTVTTEVTSPYRDQALRLAWITEEQVEADYNNAIEAAEECDTVIMFTRTGATGHGPVFQTDYDLSIDDLEEIKAVQEAAKKNGNKFILVVNSRTAFTFEGDWLDDTDSLISAFYAGQSYGTAIAEILTGEVNPSGKTTMTFPKTSEDTLLTIDEETKIERAGDQLNADQNDGGFTAHYTEGLNFGYRWYDYEDIEPMYAFGHGLSYTTFEYSDLKATMRDDNQIDVEVTVTNTGDVTGDEIVQVYLGDIEGLPEHVQVAEKQLVAFDRVENIKPGQSKKVTMTINERMLSYWDTELLDEDDPEYDTTEKWVFAEGARDIMVGGASDDLPLVIEDFQVVDSSENASEVDKVSLDGMIRTVEALNEDDYTAESWAAVAEALEAAKEISEDVDATQSKVDAALVNLIKAFGGLEYGVQAQVLNIAIAEAKSILQEFEETDGLEDGYQEDKVEALKAALEAAEACQAKEDATQEEVNEAAIELIKAINNLVEITDVQRLSNLVLMAEKLISDKYTSESLASLEAAIEAANEVIAMENPTDLEVTTAYRNLATAIANLKMKGEKDALASILDLAEDILENSGDYVASTIEGLETAVEEARAVYEDDNATQDEIVAAVEALTGEVLKARVKGDVNGDGNVTTADAAALLSYAAETNQLGDEQLEAADVNGDGVADTKDAVEILKYSAEKISSF